MPNTADYEPIFAFLKSTKTVDGEGTEQHGT